MELGLAGKTVIITGGGSNIGRAISLGFARERANVVIAEIDEVQGQKTADEGNKLGGKVIVSRTDVTNRESVEATVKKALAEFEKIDILVNNVGFPITKPFVTSTPEEWDKQIKLNFLSNVICTKAVIDHMISRKSGSIVSLASDAGRMGEFNQAIYSGTKGAVIAFSKALAREVARYQIRLNCVAPGITPPEKKEEAGKQSMWSGITKEAAAEQFDKIAKAYPLGRVTRADDMVGAVLFLASDAASFVTGQTLSVSGGYTMA